MAVTVGVSSLMHGSPHHVGCAVDNLSDAVTTYADAFGLRRRTRPFDVSSQRVRVCFLELGHHVYLELVAALDDRARVGRGGRFCQFFFTPQRHLIELAEMSVNDFAEFFDSNMAGDVTNTDGSSRPSLAGRSLSS